MSDINQQATPIPGGVPPPNAQLHEVYNLEGIDTIWGRAVPQSAREEPTVYNRAEQPGPGTLLIFYEVTRYSRKRNT